MCLAIRSSKDRQFRRHCRQAVAVSLLLYLFCSQASLHVHSRLAGLILAGLAGASIFAELVSFGLLVTKLRDEFQRILLTRSFVWGTLITMAFAMIWGFVELHGHGSVPHLDIVWVPMMLILVVTGAKVFIFRQHRPEHE